MEPTVVVYTVPTSGASLDAWKNALASTRQGSVSADGKWVVEPAAGWTVERTGLGQYVVNHYSGKTNYSVGVTADPNTTYNAKLAPASAGANSFTVYIMDGTGASQDGAFTFTLCFIN